MVQIIIVTSVFIILSGMMAIIEAAILSITRAEVEVMVQRNNPGARYLQKIKSQVTRAVVVIVVITNSINILGPILVGTLAVEVYGNTVIGVITAMLTLGTIIFSEIIPKSLGTHYAPRISRLVAPVLYVLTIVLIPIVIPFEKLTAAFKRGERRIGTEDQIKSLVRLGHSAGYIESNEKEIVHRVFQLNDKTASEIMIPRSEVTALSATATIGEAADTAAGSPYSRYPVINDDGNVTGVVMSHDILQALASSRDEEPVIQLSRQPLEISGGVQADTLLELFQEKHVHMAVVIEQDIPVGIVTLEDVLEELVGEIVDEKNV